jgi:hypothetical protein
VKSGEVSCPSDRHRKFREVEINDGEYTRNFVD